MATSMMHAKPEDGGTYTYSSQPRAVMQTKKYRDQTAYGNIMHDRRIVRGNTYALHTLPASSQPDPLELQRQQESRRRALARKRAKEHMKPHSPEPVEGRKHIEVQTELYLEEITDRVEEADMGTQTDAFLDRPPTPLFIPAKTGMDVATQIEEGDLFNFDLEVRPILEVLVGKTVEQALLEVMEEEELAALRVQQRQFEENRNAELVETQRLEEQERRRREEKERRMQQQREALMKEKETAEKIAARAFAQSYLADLVPSVFGALNESGFFYNPVEREVETMFMPWLMEEAEKEMDKKILARTLLDAIIRTVIMRHLGITPPEPETPPSGPSTASKPEPTNAPEQEATQTPAAATPTSKPQETTESEASPTTETTDQGETKEEEERTEKTEGAESAGEKPAGEKSQSETEQPQTEAEKEGEQQGDPEVPEGEQQQQEGEGSSPPEQGESGETTAEGSGDKPPEESGGDKPPEESGGDKPPEESGGDKPPEESGGDKPPEESGGDKPPEESGGDKPDEGTEEPTS